MALRSRHGFYRRHGGTRLTLTPAELDVLGGIAAAMGQLIETDEPQDTDPLAELVGIDDEAEVPADPALLRLFPDAYPGDEEAASEFRRFTERGLRQLKAHRVGRLLSLVVEMAEQIDEDGDDATAQVAADDAEVLLGALNDMRLVLGSRLGIVADDQDVGADWAEGDPRHQQFDVYQWLTWLQSTLLETLHG